MVLKISRENIIRVVAGPRDERVVEELLDQFYDGEISLRTAYRRIAELETRDEFRGKDLRSRFDRRKWEVAQTGCCDTPMNTLPPARYADSAG